VQLHGALAAGTPKQREGFLQPRLTAQVFGEKAADALIDCITGLLMHSGIWALPFQSDVMKADTAGIGH
jgi:hypothetical protein